MGQCAPLQSYPAGRYNRDAVKHFCIMRGRSLAGLHADMTTKLQSHSMILLATPLGVPGKAVLVGRWTWLVTLRYSGQNWGNGA